MSPRARTSARDSAISLFLATSWMAHRRGRRAKRPKDGTAPHPGFSHLKQDQSERRVADAVSDDNTRLSSKLLRHFYNQVKPFRDFVPPTCNLTEGPDDFRKLVTELVIGSPADRLLEVEPDWQVDSDMKDVSSDAL